MQVQPNILVASLAHKAAQIAIIRIHLNGSCAIPLKILEPSNFDLLTWAFCNFSETLPSTPSCLLVIDCGAASSIECLSSIMLRTHVGDVLLKFIDQTDALSKTEIGTLAQAVIAAIRPNNIDLLALLAPTIGSELDAFSEPANDCELRYSIGGSLVVASGIDFVPGYLIAGTADGYTFFRVANVRMRAGVPVKMTLILASPLGAGAIARAMLIGDGRHTSARIASTL